MNISGPAAVAKPEMLFYAPGDLTVTASIWFCKFYCGKAVEVGLIKETPTIVQQGKKTVLDRGLVWGGLYGRCPMPPSSVKVSPDMNLKSGLASWTQTRPISVSAFP